MANALHVLRDAFTGLPRTTLLLALCAFINRSGTMVLPFLEIYLGHRFSFSVEQAGLFLSLYGLGSIFGNMLGGWLSDRIGPVRLQILSLAASAVWFTLIAWLREPGLLAGGVFVLGLLADMFRPGSMTAVIDSVPPALRSKALAFHRLAINAGWAIGPTIGGFLVSVDFTWLFLCDGATCAAAALALWWLVPALPHRPTADAGAPAQSPLRDRHFLVLMLCNALLMLAFMQYFSTAMRWLHDEAGYAEREVGLLLAINPVMIILLEMPLVHALRGRRPLPIVAIGALCIGASYLFLLGGTGLTFVIPMLVLLTLGEMLESPFLATHIGDHAPAALRGRYIGAYGANFSIAWMLAPALGGVLCERGGAPALWWCCGGIGVLAAAGFWWRHRSANA